MAATKFWTDARIGLAKKTLAGCDVVNSAALSKLSKVLGRPVSLATLDGAFRRAGEPSPGTFVKAVQTGGPESGVDLQRLFQAVKGKGVKFSTLCDKLDLSPARVRALLEEADALGMGVKVAHDHVGVDFTSTDDRIRETGVSPVVGERQRIAVISDLHLGSRYCLRKQLVDFVEHAYQQGVREILCPGDVLDGDYRHGKFEMSHMGLEAQTEDLFETLPEKPGLTYHKITGNHDFTFTEESGVNVGRYISNYFASRGRKDVLFYGDRGAFLRVRGAVVHLWHPRSGASYARSYALQKHIEKYSSGEKPHILLAGHWHVFCHVYERGVHAFACPTFQGGGSAFSKSLGGAPAIGGLILSFGMTAEGTMRELTAETRFYFEKEEPIRIDDRDSGIPVLKSRKK